MDIEIETGKLQSMALRLCGPEERTNVMAYINGSSEVRLSELIYKLLEHGADRRAILSELRRLRINDNDIADAFSEAINNTVKSAINEEAK